MNKDNCFLAEAYEKVLEKKAHCKSAKEGCDCSKCEECKDNQKVEEAKDSSKLAKNYPPYDKVTRGDIIAGALKKKKTKKEEEEELKEAYETILEYKLINKKFARRYSKLTAAMLKAQPNSDEYGKLKSEREDLVSILKDHGMTPKDLEEYLVKKEIENPLPEVTEPQKYNQYKDNTYSDTADITINNSELPVSQNSPSISTPEQVVAARAAQ